MASDAVYLINGIKESASFLEPYDDVDEFNPAHALPGEYGKHINGNLGQSLFPTKSPVSGKQSTNNNIQIIVNGKGSLNHRTVGVAHEFGHVVLYLRGLPYSHFQKGVDSFINNRTSRMSKKLGYDY